MNTIDRIANINAKKRHMEEVSHRQATEEQNKVEQFTADILALKDRIRDLVEVGNALTETGLIHTNEPMSYHIGEDGRLSKHGYPHSIYADGCYHHVGFMEGLYNSKKMSNIGFRNGGACGKWDFYTNGYDVWEQYEESPYNHRPPTIYSLTKFLAEFPAFESAFYAWVDEITKM